jgi:hypothetical protein
MSLLTNLVAYWKFDENSGTIANDSSGTNNGTLSGSTGVPSWVSGKINSGLSFNNTNKQYVSIPNSSPLNPTNGISVQAWINSTSYPGNDRILQKGNSDNQYRLLNEGGLKWEVIVGGVAQTLLGTIPTNGVFHYVLGTYDGSSGAMVLYVDGAVLVSGTKTAGTLSTTTDPLTIGTKNNSGATGDYFSGIIDEPAIWSRTLTSSENTQLYNSGLGLQYPFNSLISPIQQTTSGIYVVQNPMVLGY